MKLNRQTENDGRLQDNYSSDLFKNKEFGLKVIGVASNYPGITVKRISIDDGKRNSEGSISTVIGKIDNIESFVKEYRDVELEDVRLVGDYNDLTITVGAYFFSNTIRIGYPKGSNFASQEFVDELEILANRISI